MCAGQLLPLCTCHLGACGKGININDGMDVGKELASSPTPSREKGSGTHCLVHYPKNHRISDTIIFLSVHKSVCVHVLFDTCPFFEP